MPHKLLRMHRAEPGTLRDRPVMLAIAGDSAAGKTTITSGLVRALGAGALHRGVRGRLPPLRPAGAQGPAVHGPAPGLQLRRHHGAASAAARHRPPDPQARLRSPHRRADPARTHHAEEFVIVEGLLPLHTKLAAACFDVTVYLNPPEEIRREWKIKRDTAQRGYTREQVLAELGRREPESEAFIRPQRRHADIVVRFVRRAADDPPGTPLSAELLLRPTIRHPDLSGILAESGPPMHLKLTRDEDGRPVDALHIHGYAPREESLMLEKAIWAGLGEGTELPAFSGSWRRGRRSEPLAITQLLLLYHLIEAAR